MAALARLQASSCANPVLDIYTQVSGVLTNVYALAFRIFDVTTGTAVQVWPEDEDEREDVLVDEDCPDGDRIGTGHYVARWDVPADANIGSYLITWYIKLTAGSSEQASSEEFEVLAEVVGGFDLDPRYCTLQSMRDEGVPTSVTDAHLLRRITLASRFVEMATKRFFNPRELTFRIDGSGGPRLLLSHPIISIATVAFEISPVYPDEFRPIESDTIRVYNRHLSQGLLSPDDRNNPKIELFNPGFARNDRAMLMRLHFPLGQQSVEITGVFGYTDPDGTATGKTPDLITHVTKLIVMRELDKMARVGARFDTRARPRLTSERTRDQSYNLNAAPVSTLLTGDMEIDGILANYMRPPGLGAA